MGLNTDLIVLTPGELPAGYCFESWQRLNVDILSRAKVRYRNDIGVTYWNIGGATPSAENRVWPWLNTNDGRVYFWSTAFGVWVSPFDVEAASDWRRIWVGTLNDLKTADGGTDEAVTAVTGPFWEADTAFATRAPIGVGTLPDSSTAVGVGDTGGSEKHTLTEAEGAVGNHTHPVGLFNQSGGGNADDAYFNKTGVQTVESYNGRYITGGNGIINATLTQADIFTLMANNGAGKTSDPFSIMQLYIGVYFVKRTARIWRAIAG